MSMYTKIISEKEKTPEERKQELMEARQKEQVIQAYTREQIGIRKKFKKNHKRR